MLLAKWIHHKKHFYATIYTFILLTVTFISTIHTGRVVALPLQQRLPEHAIILHYAYIIYLFQGIFRVWLKKNIVQFY